MDWSVYAMIFGSLVFGAVIGTVPAVVGARRGRRKLGWIGFGSCVLGSFIAGLFLSVPCCMIFTAIIIAGTKKGSAKNGAPTAFCQSCGAPVARGFDFCGKCGARIGGARPDTAPKPSDNSYIIG